VISSSQPAAFISSHPASFPVFFFYFVTIPNTCDNLQFSNNCHQTSKTDCCKNKKRKTKNKKQKNEIRKFIDHFTKKEDVASGFKH